MTKIRKIKKTLGFPVDFTETLPCQQGQNRLLRKPPGNLPRFLSKTSKTPKALTRQEAHILKNRPSAVPPTYRRTLFSQKPPKKMTFFKSNGKSSICTARSKRKSYLFFIILQQKWPKKGPKIPDFHYFSLFLPS